MSVITHRAQKAASPPAAAGQVVRAPVAALLIVVAFLRSAIMRGAKWIATALQIIAEARMQRALLEAELYLNRYSHASKNDDDLPVVRPAATSNRQSQR